MNKLFNMYVYAINYVIIYTNIHIVVHITKCTFCHLIYNNNHHYLSPRKVLLIIYGRH